MTAATGAWAQTETSATHRITGTYGVITAPIDVSLPYQSTLTGICQSITGSSPTGLLSLENAIVTSGNNITIGEINGWDTPVTVTAEGNAIVTMTLKMPHSDIPFTRTITINVEPLPYTVSLKSGTKDADKWTVKVNNGTAQSLPTGVAMDDAVTLNYSGRLRVKKVTATTDAAKTPLTIEAITAGTITVKSPKSGMKYSTDGGQTKTEMTSTTDIPVQAGQKVQFYGTATKYKDTNIGGSGDGFQCKVYGNIMSLISESGYDEVTALSESQTFKSFFAENTTLTDASSLLLPATTLTHTCYSAMFMGCTSLKNAPELKATTLVEGCYEYMYSGCTSLINAPDLKAEIMANRCYSGMFYNCSNLAVAPELEAKTLAINCFHSMFYGCESLTATPVLKATTLASCCYYSMFSGCKGLTTVPADLLKATEMKVCCYAYMFKNCTSLTTAPELKAETLAQECYRSMFQDCTKLASVTCLATNISANDCTTDWLSGVAASGTFTKAPAMTSWSTGTNGIPSGWTVVDAH